MGCLVGNVTRVSEGLRMEVSRIGANLQLSANRVSEGLQISVGLICSAGDVYIIRFEKDSLLWLGADNRVGVTKYNTLSASGSWSLAEVEIEELL